MPTEEGTASIISGTTSTTSFKRGMGITTKPEDVLAVSYGDQ